MDVYQEVLFTVPTESDGPVDGDEEGPDKMISKLFLEGEDYDKNG